LPKPYMNRTRKPETSFLGFMSTEIEKLDVKADARRTSMGFGTKDYELAENAIKEIDSFQAMDSKTEETRR